jgi:cation/acetate symporter
MSADTPTIVIFVVLIALTLGITIWASRKTKDASSHYVAGGQIKGWQNGLAISGDFLSAATFLGYTGLIALAGFSGFYLMVGGTVALLFLLFLIAEPLRNLGRYTVGDALTSRFNTTAVRSVAALTTIVISIPYLITQLVGAGAILELLLGANYIISVIAIGILIAIYITVGGMVATTWIQLVKAILLLTAFFVLAFLVLARFDFNPVAIFNETSAQLGAEALTPPHGLMAGLGALSLGMALFFGVPGLPHVLIRFFTVRDAKAARSSAAYLVWTTVIAIVTIPIIGYGAALIVGRAAIANGSQGGNMAAPMLAGALGGPILLAYVSAIAFATIIAIMAGLVIAASGGIAHDVYNNIIRKGMATEREQFMAGRITAVLVCTLAILLSLGLRNVNIAILVAVPLVIAASANFPVILLTLYWKKFNTSGAVTGMLTGLIASVGLIMLGPTGMGENAPFPLTNPALVSVPLGFLGCYVGTLLNFSFSRQGQPLGREISYDEIYVLINTGLHVPAEELPAARTGRKA